MSMLGEYRDPDDLFEAVYAFFNVAPASPFLPKPLVPVEELRDRSQGRHTYVFGASLYSHAPGSAACSVTLNTRGD